MVDSGWCLSFCPRTGSRSDWLKRSLVYDGVCFQSESKPLRVKEYLPGYWMSVEDTPLQGYRSGTRRGATLRGWHLRSWIWFRLCRRRCTRRSLRRRGLRLLLRGLCVVPWLWRRSWSRRRPGRLGTRRGGPGFRGPGSSRRRIWRGCSGPGIG